MWKDSIRNIVVIFQPNILRIVGFYVRHSADVNSVIKYLIFASSSIITVWRPLGKYNYQ